MAKDPMASPASAEQADLNTRAALSAVNVNMSRISVLALALGVGLTVLLLMMMPLKRAVPYVVEVNQSTGEVSMPQNQNVGKFDPGWANASFFVRRWLSDLFTINQYLTVNITDPRAQAFIRGSNAISEYKDFRASDKTFERLVSDPALTRDVKVLSLTPVAGTKNGAVAQVALTTR